MVPKRRTVAVAAVAGPSRRPSARGVRVELRNIAVFAKVAVEVARH